MHGNPILLIGLGSDDETYRTLVETVITAVAAAYGAQVKILSTLCWDLLDSVSAAGMKPDLLIFHHGTISRAMESSTRFICQRYRPVRILFLGSRIPDGIKTLSLHMSREEIALYTSIRNVHDWEAIGAALGRDIQWLLEQKNEEQTQRQLRA